MQTYSLGRHISWRVGLAVAALILVLITVLCALIWEPDDHLVYRGTAVDAARAVDRTGNRLTLDTAKLPERVRDPDGEAWLYAVDERGKVLRYGDVPQEYVEFLKLSSALRNSDIRSIDPRYAACLVVERRDWGRLHVLVGGLTTRGFFAEIGPFLTLILLVLAVPVAGGLMLVVPWIVRGSLGGIRQLAEEAARIDMTRKGPLLKANRVPLEIKSLVDAFNQSVSKLWDTIAARDRFLRDAAHELRVPIAIVRTRAGALPRGPARTHLLGDVVRLENIAEQLLDLQRIDHGAMHRSPVDLVALCQEVGEDFAPLLLDAGYEFSFEAPEHLVEVQADRGALQRVIINLLQNAMNHGGGQGEIQLIVNDHAEILVCDAGPGVPADQREQIFSPFVRFSSTVQGSGLGLHLAAEIVHRHQGSIRVSDSASGGACFTVSLPADAGTQKPRR